jgi:hypothetical protein
VKFQGEISRAGFIVIYDGFALFFLHIFFRLFFRRLQNQPFWTPTDDPQTTPETTLGTPRPAPQRHRIPPHPRTRVRTQPAAHDAPGLVPSPGAGPQPRAPHVTQGPISGPGSDYLAHYPSCARHVQIPYQILPGCPPGDPFWPIPQQTLVRYLSKRMIRNLRGPSRDPAAASNWEPNQFFLSHGSLRHPA